MKITIQKLTRSLLLFSAVSVSSNAFAASGTIAVAANFTKTIEQLGHDFEKQSGHKLKFAFGPTGKLYAQIKNGAPFDAFFGADERRPLKTVQDGMAKQASYLVYAQGQIALYANDAKKYPVAEKPLEVLQAGEFKHLAIANPKTAPYGERAQAFLKSKGLYEGIKRKLVNGESIAHAYQYVATGNAPIGFIALSQIVDPQSPIYQKGAYWVVPQNDYAPIKQGAVILKRGENNPAVTEFFEYLTTPKAIEIIESYGYSTSN